MSRRLQRRRTTFRRRRRRTTFRRRRRLIRPRLQRRRKITIRKLLGRGINRPYVDKRNRLMLGSGSSNKTTKQTGGFFPIGPALAAAPPIIDLLNKIIR